jgi:hypothetical protein
MKKVILLLTAVFTCICVSAQEKGTISYLDKNPSFGGITLGDSITKPGYMRMLSILKDKGNGSLNCTVIDPKAERFEISGIYPFTIFVSIENRIITNMLIYYNIDDEDIVNSYLISLYGVYETFKDGNRNWYGKNVYITAGHDWEHKLYSVIISSL